MLLNTLCLLRLPIYYIIKYLKINVVVSKTLKHQKIILNSQCIIQAHQKLKVLMSLLETINSPDDLKRIPAHQLPNVAAELRQLIIETCSKNGGHLAPSLGVVELTIAMHRVFQTPSDKIIWDVGHQAYVY